ncbi:threonine aldolase [Robbsia andropogonis]
MSMQDFASDNYAGVCPEAMRYMVNANDTGHEVAYGNDSWTNQVCDRIRTLFETDCEVFFVFNGTAANSLALASLCQSYQSVICHELSHVETDECGGPEFFSNGSKLITSRGPLGKLDPVAVEAVITRRNDIHWPRPKAMTLTQSTEVGTVYSIAEIRALTDIAHRHGLAVHMDGARFANAVASLQVTPAEMTWKAGVDVLCFGGTKNGLPVGEAVVFFDKARAEDFAYRVKQAGQLASKMRFISAPWLGLLDNDVWLRNARHANEMARRLAQEVASAGVKVAHPVQANAVFADMTPATSAAMRAKGWVFHDFIAAGGCRLMCAWDTPEALVERFGTDLRAATATA